MSVLISQKLEEQAKRLLTLLDPSQSKITPPNKPLFVEIAGTSKAGKSTMQDILYTFFRRTGFMVHIFPEAAGTIEVDKKDWIRYNVRAGTYAIDNLIDKLQARYHVVIFERSLFDILAWFRFLFEKGEIDEEAMRLNQSFFSQKELTELLDVVVFLTCTPEVAFQRELSVLEKLGSRMNPEIQRMISSSFEETAKQFSGHFCDFYRFENNGSDPRAFAEKLTATILQDLILKLDPSA